MSLRKAFQLVSVLLILGLILSACAGAPTQPGEPTARLRIQHPLPHGHAHMQSDGA